MWWSEVWWSEVWWSAVASCMCNVVERGGECSVLQLAGEE